MVKKKEPINLRTARKFTVKLFKVLRLSGGSWSGGHTSFDWTPYLPKDGKPGKPCLLSTRRALKLCRYGLHVSARPVQWGAYSTPNSSTRIFEAKVFGPSKGSIGKRGGYGQKICVYKVQLIREVYNPTRAVQDTTEWQRITDPSFQNRGR